MSQEVVEGYIESYDPVRGVAIVNTLKGEVILHIAGYYGNIERTMKGNRRVIGDLMERDGKLWFRTAQPVETVSA
jgi:hypothetical protein